MLSFAMTDRDREQSVGCQTERVTKHHHAHKEIKKTAIPISVEIIKLFTTNVAATGRLPHYINRIRTELRLRPWPHG
jgi:hypothetical protein